MKISEDYNSLLNYCKVLIKKYKFQEEPEEIVSEAYILFEEKKAPYSKQYFINLLNHVCYRLRGEIQTINLDEIWKKDNVCDFKYCTKCKQNKTVGEFYYGKKTNKLSQYCKECEKSKYKRKTDPNILGVRNDMRTYMRNYRAKKKRLTSVSSTSIIEPLNTIDKYNYLMEFKMSLDNCETISCEELMRLFRIEQLLKRERKTI